MNKQFTLIMLSFLLLAGCAKEDIQVLNDQTLEIRNGNGKQVTKPFKATWQILPGGFTGPCDLNGSPGLQYENAGLEGHATHMGAVSYETAGCLSFGVGNHGEGTITAADGDVAYWSYSIQFSINPDNPDIEDWNGTFSINGGTGKFEGAYGEGVVTGIADLSDVFNPSFLPFGELNGTITY